VALAVTEATFDRDVVELSKRTPVVVDFWAEWCGPCKALSPALEAAEAKRGGQVLLAKVDVDSNQSLAGRFGVQGIPAVKAFRDGEVVDEFVGAVPPAKVEAFFDSLLPSRADELLEKGDELSLREAAELEPRRADIAVRLGRARLSVGRRRRRWRRWPGTKPTSARPASPPACGWAKPGSAPRPSQLLTAASARPPSTP
jgi:putative thioredoxin